MALKYTGRANTFNFHGKIYTTPENYRKHPHLYDASYDSPITGLSKDQALKMASMSTLHSFEEDGSDLLEKETIPTIAGVDTSILDPDDVKKEVARMKKDAE